MMNVKSALSGIFSCSIASTYPTLERIPVIVQAAQSQKFGDYQCNSAMAIAKVI